MKQFSRAILGLAVVMPVVAAQRAAGQAPPPKPEPETAKSFHVVKEVWATPFKPQGETGTCWSFSTTSFLESEAHRLGRGDFDLSPMHTVYYAYLEKALRHVRSHGANRFANGGLAHDVLHVIGRHGAVPRSAYPGMSPDTAMPDHREMHKALTGMLEGVVAAGEKAPLRSRWTDGRLQAPWLDAFRGILDAYLGRPPETFAFGGRELSPAQFASEVLLLPLDEYVEVTSYSQWPFWGTGELPLPDNWIHYDRFHNVPLDDFVRIVDHALENGFSVVFDLHWTAAEAKSPKGYALGHDEEKGAVVTQDVRDSLLENWRTEDVHLEHAVGLARDESGKRFYKTKDSMGAVNDPAWRYHNLEYFSEGFLRSRVLFILVHRDALPADIRARLNPRQPAG